MAPTCTDDDVVDMTMRRWIETACCRDSWPSRLLLLFYVLDLSPKHAAAPLWAGLHWGWTGPYETGWSPDSSQLDADDASYCSWLELETLSAVR